MQFELNITQDIIDRSVCWESGQCAIATAIQEQVPLKSEYRVEIGYGPDFSPDKDTGFIYIVLTGQLFATERVYTTRNAEFARVAKEFDREELQPCRVSVELPDDIIEIGTKLGDVYARGADKYSEALAELAKS